MNKKETNSRMVKKPVFVLFSFFVLIGLAGFIFQIAIGNPARAWQAYLINFLLWSAIAQGGLLFAMVMHITKAKWSKPLQGLAESFTAFFPVSFILFLLLFLGKDHLFPWLHHDLHGKEVWLNMPFLFSRDAVGLLLLYGLGFGYLYYDLRLKLNGVESDGTKKRVCRTFLNKCWSGNDFDAQDCQKKMGIISVFYIIAYAIVLSLIALDLVMSMDPHWYSTLFAAYSFVKAFYLGLGALIILACLRNLKGYSDLNSSHFHDLGKLFFAFCLAWADFFYSQFIVIWYGNISEETSYIIQRTMIAPWNKLAWVVFALCFIIPFVILLNKKVKTKPRFMIVLCSVVIIGLWLEHLLLLGPALNHNSATIPLGFTDGLITLGFLGLMVMAVSYFFNLFPELARISSERVI